MRDQRVSIPSADGVTVIPEPPEAVAGAVAAVLVPQHRPPPVPEPEETANFLTAEQFARRLGISHETVRRPAIEGVLPYTVVFQSATKTTRRFPRRFADEFTASGLDAADLAEFATVSRAQGMGAATNVTEAGAHGDEVRARR
jgi:hypothetical protein